MSLSLLAMVAAVTAGTSLLLATLGEIISEKGGIINLGCRLSALRFLSIYYSWHPT